MNKKIKVGILVALLVIALTVLLVRYLRKDTFTILPGHNVTAYHAVDGNHTHPNDGSHPIKSTLLNSSECPKNPTLCGSYKWKPTWEPNNPQKPKGVSTGASDAEFIKNLKNKPDKTLTPEEQSAKNLADNCTGSVPDPACVLAVKDLLCGVKCSSDDCGVSYDGTHCCIVDYTKPDDTCEGPNPTH